VGSKVILGGEYITMKKNNPAMERGAFFTRRRVTCVYLTGRASYSLGDRTSVGAYYEKKHKR